jgi:hypothetical protein
MLCIDGMKEAVGVFAICLGEILGVGINTWQMMWTTSHVMRQLTSARFLPTHVLYL